MGVEPGDGAAGGGTGGPAKIRYVQRVRDRGATYLYFRKGDWREGPLTSPDGSDELRAEVAAILARGAREAVAALPKGRTIGDELLRYAGDGARRKPSADFLAKAASTQREYLRMATEIRGCYGGTPLRNLTPGRVLEMRDVWALRGYKACNDRLQVLKNALKNATADKRIKSDPFEGVEDMTRPHDLELGNLPWEDGEVEAAIVWCVNRKLPGLARAIGLGRWAGFRRGTICRIPLGARRKAVNARREPERRLNWITEKRKVLCDKREDPRLTALIESTPNRALTIAYNQDGNPWKERQLNQALDHMLVDLAKRKLARPQLTLHGLRHARGEELAATGASDAEIMAQLEQSTEHSARIYRRRAARRRLADAAQDRIDGSNVVPLSTAPPTPGTPQERGFVKRV